MSATNFNTKNDTYRKLMGNGLTYQIPHFQRDYSWTEEEWEDLWLDLQGTIQPKGELAHYMGYLVLQSDNDKTFDVIDGQQRLTTISLIVLAVLKGLKRLIDDAQDADRNQQRLNQIRQTYIGYLDPVTLVTRSKLTLNRNNDNYFQTYLVPLGYLPMRGFRASEHGLRKAFEWFDKRVIEYVKQAKGDPGVVLAQLVESMSDKLFFTIITVTDELNAYKVFETLKAWGVRLSSTDLLKNYLFSVLHREDLHRHEMKVLELRWEELVGRLGSESFPDFLRIHWNSRFSFVRPTELFKTIRSRITTREAVFTLIRHMEEDVDTYLALTQPDASDWSLKQKGYAKELRMFSVRQPFPLLMAAHRIFSSSDFESLLRASVMISVRYNVISNQPPSEQERVYNAVAEKLSQGKLSDAAVVIGALSTIYPSDELFRAAFAGKSLRTTQSRNKRVVRYILCELEKRLTETALDLDSDSVNLEHILPENPETGWEEFSDEDVEVLMHRLGNLTLLKKTVNKNLGNASFAVKKPMYEASGFGITKKIAEDNVNWTPERLAARQTWMANQATAIWRIDRLS
ncbi:DUF262 domain-containing protein [Candidatus Cyanaurora vandensis]|uniref:DUF262 domain-containing protein n=1 Tax=Candidatus Cyanaurora vandensis TaxID=2714958 RepID=UPI00257D76EB|nr:DUF262 domain-containing HNH endonuclease family protein [Candidatus Cyanaurora vandensis]